MSPQPTDQQLRAAWERERGPGWPQTYEAAMADPVLSRLVAVAAKRPLYQAARAAANPGPRTTARCPFCGCRSEQAGQPRPLDHRQRAAGERLDD